MTMLYNYDTVVQTVILQDVLSTSPFLKLNDCVAHAMESGTFWCRSICLSHIKKNEKT